MKHYAKYLFFWFSVLVPLSFAGTVYNSNGSRADTQAKVDLCINGDTVVLPPGTFDWPTYIVITTAITLQGAGIGQTILRDTNTTTENGIISWTLVAANASRMTGIEFQNGGRVFANFNGLLPIFGSNLDGSTMRVDHCKFDHLKGVFLNPNDVIGVIDHNVFLTNATFIPIYVFHKNWDGFPYAAGSWSAASNFGSSQFLFIETNTFTRDADAAPYGVVDCYGGARWVFRYNVVTNGALEIHGTDSGGRFRGGRAFEVYSNTFISGAIPPTYIVNFRSGIALVYNNTSTGIPSGVFELRCYRTFYPFWYGDAYDGGTGAGGAAGKSVWDINEPGGPFYSGTAASGTSPSGGLVTVTIGSSPWTVNQWVGYSVIKTSGVTTTQFASEIVSNTANTITYLDNGAFDPSSMTFSNGNTFQIWKCNQALDSPGRSGGGLVLGDTPILPVGWNDQITDPCYEWNNLTTEGGANHFSSGSAIIRLNEHYYNSTPKPGYVPFTYPNPLTDPQPSIGMSGRAVLSGKAILR